MAAEDGGTRNRSSSWKLPLYLAGTVIGVCTAVAAALVPIDHRLFVQEGETIPDRPSESAPETEPLTTGLNYIVPDQFTPLDRWDEFDGRIPDRSSVTLGEQGFSFIPNSDEIGLGIGLVNAIAEVMNTDDDYFARVVIEARSHDEGDRSGTDQTSTFEALVSPGRSAYVAGTINPPCDMCDDQFSVSFSIADLTWYTLESDEVRAAFAEGRDPSLAEIEIVEIESFLYPSIYDPVNAMLSIDLPSDLAAWPDITAVFRDENGTLIGGGSAVPDFPLIPPGRSERAVEMYSDLVPWETDLSKTEFQLSGIKAVYA